MPMSDKPILPGPDGIEPINLKDALEERYLAYALTTIMHRALPDVRDGLKPVHRRIVYAMRELRLDPDGGFLKCAKIVGEVMGDYHPHGNQAIYDALARLAQDFAVRYPLVDGQGNFGNIDGDNPAAERYTEARMTAMAATLLEGIEEEMRRLPSQLRRAQVQEPAVLPAAFPNLLANGSSGIAVGMATNIPPHNVDELCAGLLHLIKHPNATIEKLVEMIPGPGLPRPAACWSSRRSRSSKPTRPAAAASACAPSGTKEETGRGTYQIVVTEIPYQVQKAKLVERIAELMTEKKLPLLGDVRDESAEEIRLILEPKSRTVDPRAADGEPVPLHRAGAALRPQHERAVGGAGPQRARPARRAAPVAGAPRRRAGEALAVPPAEDRAPPGGARRLSRRLPQHRRGDPHRPLRGRPEGAS